MVNLCINSGHSALAAIAYSHYGLILCGMGDMDAGYHSGELAMKLQDKFQANEFKCKVHMLFNGFIRLWKDPAKACILPLLEAMQTGLDTGDIEFAGYSTFLYCDKAFGTGVLLEEVEQKQRSHIQLMTRFKQEFTIYHDKVWHQLILNFQGLVENCDRSIGESFDETEMLAYLKATNNGMSLFTAYVAKTMLAYHFGKFSEALNNAVSAIDYAGGGTGTLAAAVHNFYHSLSLLSVCSQAHPNKQAEYLQAVAANQKIMQHWANCAPCNYLHKLNLVQAEQHRVLQEKADAIAMYDRAIVGAKTNEYIQEEALANELAAKFYLDWGKEKVASGYMQEAYYCYAKWGAKAKTDDLEKRYPQLLQPILQPATQPLAVLETLASIVAPAYSFHSTHSKSSSSTSLNNTLDFAALLKVSQAMSRTIQLEDLIQTLTQTMLENSGADKCALMLRQNEKWFVRAMSDLQQTTLQTVPLKDNLSLPIQLINYVKNTLEPIVLDNLKTEIPVANDPYLQQHQPQSVLCFPILDRGNLTGILYLENRATKGVFTNDRLVVLNFLASQAAIALENARLYHQVQQTLEELQQAQIQLVQSEKMSALGNLVAGVAHEINNPVGCIVGNVGAAQDYINDLLNLIDLYADKFPQPGAEIEGELEAIDLDYVREDLPKLIRAMKDGGTRIKSISNSLRTFSRADSDTKQKFNLHEGIDSTLLILRHRLKANENRPAIEVVTDYGNLPEIACFPGQLNQVFMNILANAIDALDESNSGRSYADIQASPNRITIRTTVEGGQVKIAIADNGPGIPEAVKTQIFDHLFTTKPVGKGTGLGLAIARQIIVEKHGGKIQVDSELRQGTTFTLQLSIAA